jgi:predicted pyridoxine 5'-phosphate oxidase superfamily flavin-nucleotide-binding protein
MARAFAKLAFTPTVQSIQKQQGSAETYQKFLENDAEQANKLTNREIEFISERDGFYQSSVSETNWPYVQFRGGPKGFLKIIDEQTIAYADYRGNRQYISTGNLTTNNRTSLILMDYPNRRRLKIWGEVNIIEPSSNPTLISNLHDETYRALPERAIQITIKAFDWNCPQHIPQRLTLEELEPHIQPLREEIEKLKEENKRLKQQTND